MYHPPFPLVERVARLLAGLKHFDMSAFGLYLTVERLETAEPQSVRV
jgi:hypothetical protein